jgi:hypothetical protein
VSILPQIGCLCIRDFSKESEHFLGKRRFPLGVHDILAPQPEAKNWPSEE